MKKKKTSRVRAAASGILICGPLLAIGVAKADSPQGALVIETEAMDFGRFDFYSPPRRDVELRLSSDGSVRLQRGAGNAVAPASGARAGRIIIRGDAGRAVIVTCSKRQFSLKAANGQELPVTRYRLTVLSEKKLGGTLICQPGQKQQQQFRLSEKNGSLALSVSASLQLPAGFRAAGSLAEFRMPDLEVQIVYASDG